MFVMALASFSSLLEAFFLLGQLPKISNLGNPVNYIKLVTPEWWQWSEKDGSVQQEDVVVKWFTSSAGFKMWLCHLTSWVASHGSLYHFRFLFPHA